MTSPHPPNRSVASFGGFVGILLSLFFIVAGVFLIVNVKQKAGGIDGDVLSQLTMYLAIIIAIGALLLGAGIAAANGSPAGCVIGGIVCVAIFAVTMMAKHNPGDYSWALLPEFAYVLMAKNVTIIPTLTNAVLVTSGVGALLFFCGIVQTVGYHSWQRELYAQALPHSRLMPRPTHGVQPPLPGPPSIGSQHAPGWQSAAPQPPPQPPQPPAPQPAPGWSRPDSDGGGKSNS